MSETLAVASYNVRLLINDDNAARYCVDSVTLAHLLVAKGQELGSECGLGHTWLPNAFALVANSLSDYTLPTSVDYSTVQYMRIAATGNTMYAVSMPVIQAMREGLKSGDRGSGDPTFYCVWEDAPGAPNDSEVRVRINTIPNAVRNIDVYRSVLPVSTYSDATVLPFNELLCRAIERAVAMECFHRMTPQQRAERMLGDDVAAVWGRDVMDNTRREKYRQARMATAQVLPGALSW